MLALDRKTASERLASSLLLMAQTLGTGQPAESLLLGVKATT